MRSAGACGMGCPAGWSPPLSSRPVSMWISQPSIGSCPVWTPSSRPLGGATGRASALRRTASSPSFREKIHLPVCLRPPSAPGRSSWITARTSASRAAIHAYFSTLLDLKGAEAQDAHHILPLMESEFFPFRTVAERFHLIESPTINRVPSSGGGRRSLWNCCGAVEYSRHTVPPPGAIRRVGLSAAFSGIGAGRGAGASGGRLRGPAGYWAVYTDYRADSGAQRWKCPVHRIGRRIH